MASLYTVYTVVHLTLNCVPSRYAVVHTGKMAYVIVNMGRYQQRSHVVIDVLPAASSSLGMQFRKSRAQSRTIAAIMVLSLSSLGAL